MRDETTVAPATAAHHEHFVRLHRELGLDDAPPPLEPWLAAMAPNSFFLELDGRVVAYGWCQMFGDCGYVKHVIVDAAHRGRGFGRAVMREHARRAREAGLTRWRLNVLTDNRVAIALYESLGMQREFETWVVRLQPALIATLPAPRATVTTRDLDASEDANVERCFEMPAGVLAGSRKLPGQRWVVVEKRGATQPVGFARFDPSHPGCWPFRAREPEYARALLEAVLPDVPREAASLQLVIERDERTARALIDAGAMLRHEIVHMSGLVPEL